MVQYEFDADQASQKAGILSDAALDMAATESITVSVGLDDAEYARHINSALRMFQTAMNKNRRLSAQWLRQYSLRLQAAAHDVRSFDGELTANVQSDASMMDELKRINNGLADAMRNALGVSGNEDDTPDLTD